MIKLNVIIIIINITFMEIKFPFTHYNTCSGAKNGGVG